MIAAEFPFMADLIEPDEPAFRLSEAHRNIYRAMGLEEIDLKALEHVVSNGGDFDRCRDAMCDYRQRGSEVLRHLQACLENAVPGKLLGGDCLVSKARCDMAEFRLNNTFRCFYARILVARLKADGEEDEAERITLKPSWADRLIRAGWQPIVSGRES